MGTKKRTGIMLAYPFEERRLTDPKFKWKFPVLVQPKLDGERCRVVEFGAGPTMLSSTEELITGVPHISEALEFVKVLGIELPELDGELYCHGKSFDDIHSIVSRKYENTRHEDFQSIEYHIFDVVTDSPQIVRTTMLNGFINDVFKDCPFIHIVPSYVANNIEDIYYYYNLFIEMKYEGIIIRETSAPYVRKRSTFMLKFKEKRKDEYEIVRLIEANSAEGEPLGRVGSIECTCDGEVFSVGAGHLTHEQREYYWEFREHYPGGRCYVGYQNLTAGRKVPRSGLCITIKLGELKR